MDTLGIEATPEEVDLMIDEIDQDNNGEIDFEGKVLRPSLKWCEVVQYTQIATWRQQRQDLRCVVGSFCTWSGPLFPSALQVHANAATAPERGGSAKGTLRKDTRSRSSCTGASSQSDLFVLYVSVEKHCRVQ